MFRRFRARMNARRMLFGVLVIVLTAIPVSSVAALAAPGNSAATITGSFSDSCTDFVAGSSKHSTPEHQIQQRHDQEAASLRPGSRDADSMA
jgi:hypothetical protein